MRYYQFRKAQLFFAAARLRALSTFLRRSRALRFTLTRCCCPMSECIYKQGAARSIPNVQEYSHFLRDEAGVLLY